MPIDRIVAQPTHLFRNCTHETVVDNNGPALERREP
jgi:hypothetical protein